MAVSENISPQHNTDGLTIGLADVVRFVKDGFRTIILWCFIFGVMGIIWALTRPFEYSSGVQLLPELPSQGGSTISRLSSLAGLAGLDLDELNSTEAIRPDLYPSILQTTPFALHILNQKVYVEEFAKTMTLQDYFTQHKAGFSLWSLFSSENNTTQTLLDTSKSEQVIKLTKIQEIFVKDIKSRISAGIDKKSGIINIGVKMPEAAMAATVARFSMDYLTHYVTNYRTEKAQKDLKFLTDRTTEARKRYEQAQNSLSSRKDRSLNLVMNVAQDPIKKLQYDFDLAYNLYSELSRQLEQAKIKVQQETPVFKVHEPPQVPLQRSEPKRTIIVLIFGMVGLIISVLYLLVKRII